MTALNRNSKADTALFLNPQGAGIASLVVDIGQARTNLTNNTTYASEANSSRTALTEPREIAIVFDILSDSEGTLIEHSNAGSYSYRVTVALDGVISVAEGGTVRASVTLSEMEKDTTYKVLVSWCQRVSGTSVLSELAVYDYDRDEWQVVQATHTAGTAPSATDTLTVGAGYGGGSAYTGGPSSIYSVRVGRRFHSTTEAAEDWVAESTPPTLTARQRTPLPTATSADLPIVGEGALAGPVYVWAAAATRQADQRLITRLVDCSPRYPYVESNDYGPARYFRTAWDDDRYHVSTRYLWQAYVSPKTNKARCRVFVRVYESDALPDICTVYLRMYSVANLSTVGKGPGAFKLYKTATATISTPNGSLGEWVDLGMLQIARNADGLTDFALGFSFGLDSGAAEEGVTRLVVRHVQIDPCYVEYEGNGYDADVGLGY